VHCPTRHLTELRSRWARHTYCAARLQTLDRGAPVSLYTVSRELGHGSEDLVRRVYSHLGTVRHRSEVVEFRVEQHFERLGDQLRRLGFVITSDIKEGAGEGYEKPRDTEVSTGEDLPEWARRDSNARPLAPERRPHRQPTLTSNGNPWRRSLDRLPALAGAGGVWHNDRHTRRR
jgi:hypothetical protein